MNIAETQQALINLIVAKEKYPTGTLFECPVTGEVGVVVNEPQVKNKNIVVNDNHGCVLHNGVWAKKIDVDVSASENEKIKAIKAKLLSSGALPNSPLVNFVDNLLKN